ncbi:MAG: toprim domain-containing protein [Chloroflexota bacterium]
MATQIPVPQRQQEAEDIQALKGLEAVRLRPGMYVGGTDIHALHHLVYEVVDNSIDEAMAGRCDFIQIVIHADSSVMVSDNGGGIPVAMHPQEGISTLELVLATLHAGGKFGGGAYKVSGGLHGVGVKAVNALSRWMTAEIHRDGYVWRQTYERGIRTSEVEAIRELEPDEPTGTFISFMPDEEIFIGVREEFDYVFKTLMDRFREMAYVTRGVTIRLIDEREPVIPREHNFYFEGGLKTFVNYLNRNRDAIHDVIHGSREIKFNEGQKGEGTMEVDFAFQYTESTNTTELAFANTINTPDGGTHLTGLRTALTRVLNSYARKAGMLKDKDSNFSGRHTLEGLTAIVSVKHPNPQFESQTKVKLMNPEVSAATSSVVAEIFTEYLEVNPKEGRRIVDKCLSSMRIQEALDKQRELLLNDRKSFLSNTTLPGKLADCSDKGANTEIYIVEGDSAGGSAKQGRDRHFQAILPLRGKILNTERANLNKILDSNEIKTLISALGVGIREDFNLEKLRYGRVIIMSVAGDEPTLVMNKAGRTEFVKIGDFIDDCVEGRRDAGDYQVMSFDLKTHETRFRPLKAVIRHGHEEAMYKITTRYNRSIKVTSSHSVFVLENGQVRLKKGNEIRPGDLVVASKRLPAPAVNPTYIDLLTTFYNAGLIDGLYVKGEDVRQVAGQRVLANAARPELLSEPRVHLTESGWQELVAQRQAAGISQQQVAAAVGVKQPITISHWERGINRPIKSHFNAYIQAIGVDGVLDYELLPSKLDERLSQDDSSKNARWRVVSGYKALKEFTADEVAQLGVTVQLVPQAHGEKAFARNLPISRDLLWFLGWYVAEGTMSAHQISLNLGEKDERFIPEISAAIEAVFGETPRCYHDPDSKGIKLYFHSVAAARLLEAWGLGGKAHQKKLPDILFSLPETLQLTFLEGYFLGDGTTAGTNLAFVTNSPELKDGLLYLLGQLGLVASTTEHQPSSNALIQTRHAYYSITLSGKTQIAASREIWQRHANAWLLDEHLARPAHKALDFVPVGADLMGLEVLSAEEIDPVGDYVYDFSVNEDENFICGTGGLCAHNTDADVDGAHIRTLLLTFFYRYMNPLIQGGHLFIAQPPIFRLEYKKQIQYVYPESNMKEDQLLAKMLPNFAEPDKVGVQRYKGLGEMNPDQLWETTMNPANRTLLKVNSEDAAEADRTFDMLMGPAVPPRRKFIQTHARNATLDV